MPQAVLGMRHDAERRRREPLGARGPALERQPRRTGERVQRRQVEFAGDGFGDAPAPAVERVGTAIGEFR